MKQKEKQLIKRTVDELKKIKKVQAIILFGSYARRQQKPISDIDICIVTDKKISKEFKAEIGSHSGKKLDVSLFWDLPPAVRYSVLKEGKILFSHSDEFMHKTTVETMSEYLDFKHIIDRNIERVFG